MEGELYRFSSKAPYGAECVELTNRLVATLTCAVYTCMHWECILRLIFDAGVELSDILERCIKDIA